MASSVPLPAYNQDVDLFDAMTWVPAYENYINVVLTNHGVPGGSFAWTPRHRERKEIARLRGPDLLLAADVILPVASLLKAQEEQAGSVVKSMAAKWPEKPKCTPDDWKAPPPGFVNRR
ncbi:MAG: hypothetical protein HYZ53_04935 [Planctomycetes bacterium]|nr:hypothetical protein [Planctomycetota bacterium]